MENYYYFGLFYGFFLLKFKKTSIFGVEKIWCNPKNHTSRKLLKAQNYGNLQMRILFHFLLIFSFLSCFSPAKAQQTLSEIKYKAWDIHALRFYPFTQPADSFMEKVISQNNIQNKDTVLFQYEKTAADLAMNGQFLADVINNTSANQNQFFKFILYPYVNWLSYARLVREDSLNWNLTLFLSQHYSQKKYSAQSPLEWIGTENINRYLEQWLGEFDILNERNKVLFLSVKSPLAKDAGNTYRYFFSSRTEIDGIPVYEIAFYSKKFDEKAFEGYLYISAKDLSPVKAILTLNPRVKKAPAKAVLFIQTPEKKETLLTIGDEFSMGLLINQVRFKENKPMDSIPADFLTPAQKEISGLVEKTRNTRAYSNLQNGLSFVFTDHIGIFKDHFNLGPVTQMLSYNYMEGFRLRIGGFSSDKISDRASVGGYLAYGTEDTRWKYRGDIVLTPRSTNRFQLTYVNDLNIPGKDCLDDKRDRIYYSFSRSNTKNMSLQKIGQLSFESDGFHGFSLKVHAKYLFDQPLGTVKYETMNTGTLKTIRDITTSEIGASFRFSPNEKFLWIKGKRIVFHSPDVDFRVNHRTGFKGVFGSDYNYQITDAGISKKVDFPVNAGSFDIGFSGGKVWNKVPFPLLFIPAGNQSFIFNSDDYNLMRFYEFTTDWFVAGKADLQMNWSPVRLFSSKSGLKTHAGVKAIYGPLSDMNNPQLHSDLFIFNNGVEPLSEKIYSEVHIGLSGILKFLRIDYAYRLTYGHRGSLFLSADINL